MKAPNSHIQHFIDRHEKGMIEAERIMGKEWNQIKDEFSDYSHRKFLTQYCQERLIMVNKFSYNLIPQNHFIGAKDGSGDGKLIAGNTKQSSE